MDIKKFTKKDEEYFKKEDGGRIVAYENVLGGDDEDIYDNRPVYRYDLSCYDGPLDLLLYLVRKNKIDIENIFVSDVTRQYLEIIGPLEEWTDEEIAYAGEFIVIASELIDIKARLMLPVEEPETEGAELPGDRLKRRLMEHDLFEKMAEKMRSLETLNRFFKEPAFTDDDCRIAIKSFSIPDMLDACAKMMHRFAQEEYRAAPKKIVKERYSVSNRINFISRRLFEDKHTTLYSLFDPDFTKPEVLNTFLATLELMKRQVAEARQEGHSGDIEISLKDGVDAPVEITEEELNEQFKGNG